LGWFLYLLGGGKRGEKRGGELFAYIVSFSSPRSSKKIPFFGLERDKEEERKGRGAPFVDHCSAFILVCRGRERKERKEEREKGPRRAVGTGTWSICSWSSPIGRRRGERENRGERRTLSRDGQREVVINLLYANMWDLPAAILTGRKKKEGGKEKRKRKKSRIACRDEGHQYIVLAVRYPLYD